MPNLYREMSRPLYLATEEADVARGLTAIRDWG